MRAKLPSKDGFAERNGVKIYYEVYGEGPETMLFLPPWSIVHSRVYKAQLPYFSERFRCIAFDARGNGKSDRPTDAAAYSLDNVLADALAVMDTTDTGQAILVGLSQGGMHASVLAAYHSERVKAAILVGTVATIGPGYPYLTPRHFLAERDRFEGWDKYNRAYWLANYPDFAEHFIRNICSEPHSTKQIEDGIEWAGETMGPVLVKTVEARTIPPNFDVGEGMYRKIRCPLLLIHGDNDQIQPYARAQAVAEVTGAELFTIPGGGHNPLGRFPAKCNALINDFLDRKLGIPAPERKRAKPTTKAKKALYLSSPIGLGHGRRDIAITRELRKLHPDLQVDWLAQDPVTRLLEASGERIHPLSPRLASESRHIELESGEHDLNAFQAIRRMDEVLIANFMIFQDAVEEGGYDLVIADEAWDIDHYWHEHPELKKAELAWFTDFVGYVPMPAGGEHEAFLTTDYNAEMIEHVERHPRRARPRDLCGQSRRHRSDVIRQGPADDARLGAQALRVRRLYHRRASPSIRQPRRLASEPRLSGRRTRVHRHGRRIGRRGASDPAYSAKLPDGPRQAARSAHGRGCRSAHRSRVPQCTCRSRNARIRAEPRSSSRRVRSGSGAGRAHDLHGAHSGRNAVPLFPAEEPL